MSALRVLYVRYVGTLVSKRAGERLAAGASPVPDSLGDCTSKAKSLSDATDYVRTLVIRRLSWDTETRRIRNGFPDERHPARRAKLVAFGQPVSSSTRGVGNADSCIRVSYQFSLLIIIWNDSSCHCCGSEYE